MHYGSCASGVWCEANKYLVNLSISVVVLGAYALNKYKPMSPRFPPATLSKCNCIFACTITTHVGGSNGVNTEPVQLYLPGLTTATLLNQS